MTRSKSRIGKDRFVDRDKLLEAIGTCRKAVLEEKSKARIGGPLDHSCAVVTAAIDGLALLLTGQKEYFWLKPHSTSDVSKSGA